MTQQVTTRIFACFMALLLFGNAADAQTAAKKKTPDQVRAAIQGICPVSGMELGKHGTPVKAKIGGQVLFLCCEGCKNGKVKKEHWEKIHQNFAKAQSKCLVMDNPLPKKPKWVVVKGQLIYVCCPPCIEKIKESPDKFLKQLAATQAAYLKQKSSTKSAKRQNAAQ